jgi:hypothetical protein
LELRTVLFILTKKEAVISSPTIQSNPIKIKATDFFKTLGTAYKANIGVLRNVHKRAAYGTAYFPEE